MPTIKPESSVADTVLGHWLRRAPTQIKMELALRAGTTYSYLSTLAGVHRENPRVRLALAIVKTAEKIREEHPELHLPPITIEDLARPTRRKPNKHTY